MTTSVSRRYSDSASRWGGPGMSVPPIPLFACAFAVALWCDGWYPWRIQTESIVPLLAILGAAVAAAGILLFASGMLTFARAKTGILLQRPATRLVTHGPYRWSRNPMYVSFVALYLGGALLANTIWPLIFLPIVLVILTRYVIAREERYMDRTFADQYQEYVRQVPRWL